MKYLINILSVSFCLFLLFYLQKPLIAFAYLIFNRDGAIIQIKNSSAKEKNLIAFRQDGSIAILSTKNLNTDLAQYIRKNKTLAVLGANSDIEARKLIEKNGEIKISRNQDKSITLRLLDQNNPDLVFENQTDINLPQSQSLVYLEIMPSPITISNEGGDLYLTQDVFKIKVDHEFDAFIIKSAPENIFITAGDEEFRMGTQPIDVGRILSSQDKQYTPKSMVNQQLNLGQEPNYQINNQRVVFNLLNKPFYCDKSYLVSFQKQNLLTTNTPLLSYFTCLFPH